MFAWIVLSFLSLTARAGAPPDWASADPIALALWNACDKGEEQACLKAMGVPLTEQGAAQLGVGCKAGAGWACYLFGDLLRSDASPEDLASAASLYRLACDGGFAGGTQARRR